MADDKAKKDDKPSKEDDEGKEAKTEGAEGETGAEGDGDNKKKKIPPKIMIIAGVGAVLVLGLAGGGAYFFMHKPAGENDAAKAYEQASEEKGKPVYFSLGDLLVNLSGEGKHPNFLKVRISLELADEKDVPLMEAIKPRIIDNFQVYLRELRIEDLRGSAGMYRLREELLMRVTEAAQPVRVRDVLFQEMLVQ